MTSSSDYKRKNSLFETFLCFLEKSPKKPSLATCGPNDVRIFLVWKDKFGKTTVHDINCQYLGLKGMFECSCPNRLASATVEGLINQLVNLFDDKGLGRTWCDVERKGNPAVSPVIKEYLKLVQVGQAKAHILPKQAKPICLTKIRSISAFISRELQKDGSKLKEKFVLYRDQAWFKLQYSAGDRASDLSIVVAQEVKFLKDGSGFVFQHTFGKTLRGKKGRSNSFVIKRCDDNVVCPVKGLLDFVQFAHSCNVDLTKGYLFRVVSESGRVLEKPVSYSVVYERLRYYLSTLGIYEGETPHSFRSGCTVTMALSDSASNVDEVMNHVGWFGKASAEYYGRVNTLIDSEIVASNLASSVSQAENIELQYREKADFSGLKRVF
ncbi:uncharacterized protein LOC134697907 [Mytilus trossulus]|uniref:uncharacterized protein LOC134697907 n=1 Tax=Mytilus trossulus TaxID=6551 RepID=UPI00300704A2